MLLWTAVLLCSLLLQSGAAAAPVLAVHDEGLFELDGNATDSADPGDDWNSVNNAQDSIFIGMSKEDAAHDTTYFTSGGSKDVNDISQWAYSAGDVSPDKDQILDAYGAAYEKGGDTFVYFGADRFDGSGDSFIGFWFVQDKVGLDGHGGFNGTHRTGDILVVSDFTNGGSVSEIKVYEWVNGNLSLKASGAQCDVGDDEACAVVNAVTTSAPWAFLDKSGSSSFAAGEFYEGGINLDTVFGGDPPCFSSFIAETRSSQSTSAQLKDFALGSFDTCRPPKITTSVSAATINVGESVTDTADLTDNTPVPTGDIDFYLCGPSSSNPDCTTGGTKLGATKSLSGGTATSAAFTANSSSDVGRYCFRAEYTPDAAASTHYIGGSHTNDTTECFRVIPAGIKLTKVADHDSVSAGSPIGFTITIKSTDEGTAFGVKVADTLPTDPGLDWSIDAAGTTGDWAIDGGVLRFGGANGVSMPTGTSYHVHIVSPTTSATCGTVNNTGDATTTNDGASSASDSVVVNCPDVKVTKTPDNGAINAGDVATFSIKVENLGPGKATDVVVKDTLPAGLTWAETEADCSIAVVDGKQVLTCNVGDLAADATKTYTVSAVTSKLNCGVIDNTATVTATNERAAQDGNNSDDGAITVKCADIQVTKTADAASVSAGDQIGFTITVTNVGLGVAYDVTASDTLNGKYTWALAAPSAGWTLVGHTLTYSAASLDPGASSSVHVVAGTDATVCGVVPNTATASAANDGSDEASAQTEVLCPDVTVTKTAVASPVNAGDPIAFDIVVTNLGPGTAKGVTLTDTLPGGITWSEDSAQCTITAGVLSCDFGDLAADATAKVRVSGTTTPVVCGTVTNTAVVAATNEAEAQGDNNSDSDSVVVNCPDVTVVKTADNSPVSAGDTAAFTIVVTNLGPGSAYGVTLDDPLPAGITGWATATAGCSITAGNLHCDFGTLAAGASKTVHVSGTTSAAACTVIPNTANVAATNEAEGALGNNEDSATVEVLCPDLKVTKDADNSPISAGDVASYTIKVENIGEGNAYDASLTDPLPAGITWTTTSTGCSIADGTLTCSFGTIPAGGNRTVTVSGETTAASCGSLPNIATAAASNEPSTLLANNHDDATIVVDCPQIVITKSTVTPVVSASQGISFDIVVTNTGAGSAYGVTVNDTLPVKAGVTWSIDPANTTGTWVIENGVLKFGPATLAGGASVKARIVSGTTAASCGAIDNTANLTYEGGGDADDSSLVVQCPDVTISKTAANSPILAGQVASYTISAWNMGPGTAYDVVITDTVPAGLAWTEDSASCSIIGGVLTCQVGTLAAKGDPFTVTLSAPTTPQVCGTLPNTATVAASNEPAGLTGNNGDSATITVQCSSISLVKTAGIAADGTELLLSQPANVVFTYVVTNTGTADLKDIALVDDNATPANTADDITVICPSLTLAAGASMTCTATLPVTYGLRTNIAVVTAVPVLDVEGKVSDTDDAVVRVPEPEVTPTPTPKPTPRPTPKLTPPPTSTLDANEESANTGSGLLMVLLALAGAMLVVGYLSPTPARSRRRNDRG